MSEKLILQDDTSILHPRFIELLKSRTSTSNPANHANHEAHHFLSRPCSSATLPGLGTPKQWRVQTYVVYVGGREERVRNGTKQLPPTVSRNVRYRRNGRGARHGDPRVRQGSQEQRVIFQRQRW